MVTLTNSGSQSKSLSPEKQNLKIKYGDEFLDRFLQEFTVSEARSFIENVDSIGDLKLKTKHAFFMHLILNFFDRDLSLFDVRQTVIFPGMKNIKLHF